MTSVLTSPRTRNLRRGLAERRRRLSRQPHRVFYFHQLDDPYSHLAAQVLAPFIERYEVELVPMLVGPPPAAAAPERERLVVFSREDAAGIAPDYGLEFRDPGEQPESALLSLAGRIKRPRFPWTRIRGECDVQGGGGNGSIEEGEGFGANGGSP